MGNFRQSQPWRNNVTRLESDGSSALKSDEVPSSPMDEKRFIEELRLANGPMRALILSITQSPADLDDIYQEASQALWRKIDDYDASEPFLPWALTSSRLQALAWMKKQGREDRKLRSYALESIESAIVRENQESGRDLKHLNHCVSKLTDRQRELLHRRYHLGYTIRVCSKN